MVTENKLLGSVLRDVVKNATNKYESNSDFDSKSTSQGQQKIANSGNSALKEQQGSIASTDSTPRRGTVV